MQNMKMSVKDGRLTITVNLKERLGPSTSGKTVLIAKSGGNIDVPGNPGVKIGLNVYTKPSS